MTNNEFRAALIQRHGEEVYNRLINSRAAIAGLGGLGSNVAMLLARAGIGHLFIVDFDNVDISNLNRQQYFIKDLGRAKTDALEEKIRAVNPIIKITKRQIRVTEENACQLFEGFDVVCECFDAAENKAMLINTLLSKDKTSVIVSASGMAGCETANSISTKKINDNFYICGDGVSGVEQGLCLFAPRVAVCAGHQANMAVRLLLGMRDC